MDSDIYCRENIVPFIFKPGGSDKCSPEIICKKVVRVFSLYLLSYKRRYSTSAAPSTPAVITVAVQKPGAALAVTGSCVSSGVWTGCVVVVVLALPVDTG